MDIKRKDAAALIDRLLQEVADEIHGAGQPPSKWAEDFQVIFKAYGLEVPRPCNGDAHSNPYIDNCGVCMPNWGWIGSVTKVK